MRELTYFKTDRNGTKYFYDWNCARCGGAGFSDNWLRTGRVCYECGGTGERRKPLIVKIYTPEYEAKLAAKRKAKAEAKEQAEAADTERQEFLRQQAEKAKISRWKGEGFNENGEAYIYYGNTYPYRSELKAAGGRFVHWLKMWVCPVQLNFNADDVFELKITEAEYFTTNEYGCINEDSDKLCEIGRKIGTY